MKSVLKVLLCLLLATSSPAEAWIHGASNPTGTNLQNIPVMDAGLLFANFFKNTTAPNNLQGNPISSFTDDGYPNGTTLTQNFSISTTLPVVSTSEPMVLDWTGVIPANSLFFGAAITATSCTSSAGSGCVSNCISSGGSGSGNTTFGKAGTAGTNCRVEFTFTTQTSGLQATPNTFFNSGTAPNLTSIRLFRKADETNNGGVLPTWNPDFLKVVRGTGLNARVLRDMGNVINSGNENILANPSYALRTPLTALSYAAKRWVNAIYLGAMATTDGFNWIAGGSYPNQPGNWVDKETFQADFTGVATTVSNGSPTTVTFPFSVPAGTVFQFKSTPPTGLSGTLSTLYYTLSTGTSTTIATTPGGTALNTSASGTPTAIILGTAISSAASNGGRIQLALTDTSELSNGQVIAYTGYNTGGGSNGFGGQGYGLWTISVDDATHITLTSSYPAGNASVFVALTNSPGYITSSTVKLGTRAPKIVIGPGGLPLGAFSLNFINGTSSSPSTGTMMYDGQLDAVVYSPGGLYAGMSPDLLVNLANTANVDAWINLPSTVSDASITSIAQMANSTLRSPLNLYIEYSNEPWNTAFYQAFYFSKKSEAVGACSTPSAYGQPCNFSWVGLRTNQISKTFQANWTGTPSRLNALLNVQFSVGAYSNNVTYSFNGTNLNPTSNARLCAYLGGTFSGTCSGAPDYSSSPNRPVDNIRVVAYAPYAGTKYSTAGVLSAAQTYQSNQASGLAALQTIVTTSYSSNGAYADWETNGLQPYDGTRPSGYAPLFVVCYEGGPDLQAAQVADYTSLGVTNAGTATFNLGSSPAVNQTAHGYINGSKVSFAGGTPPTGLTLGNQYFVINATTNSYDIATTYYNQTAITLSGSPSGTTTATGSTTSFDNLFEGWKNSSNGSAWIAAYVANFKSFSHSKYMGFLQIPGDNVNLNAQPVAANQPNRWSLIQGPIWPNYVPYQTFVGVQQLQ